MSTSKNFGIRLVAFGAAIIGPAVLMVVSPALTFLLAYVGGMLLDLFVGDMLVDGLNLMFNTTRFTRDLIPLACATLATIGRYFKAHQHNSNKNK